MAITGRRAGKASLLALLLLLALAALAAEPQRVVAVGDVHGDFDGLVRILRAAGVINEKLQWSGGNTVLVQTGDVLDRGPKSRQVMDLLMALEKQAPKSRGRVIALLGNHELMNLMGDLRYVSSEEYAAFTDAKSEDRRRAGFREYAEWRRSREGTAPAGPNFEQEWMQSHPLGFFEHRQAFSALGKYGRWLRGRAAVARVGETIFLHGGIHPKLAGAGLEQINKNVREEVLAFDRFVSDLIQQNLVHSSFTLYQTTAAAKSELDRRQAVVAAREAEAAAKGKTYKPPPEDQQYMKWLESFLAYPQWYSVHPDGPLWFRGYADWAEAEDAKVGSVLQQLGAAHAVVGHTPQLNAGIRSRFGGKVFLIDTGMLSTYYRGGQASALEISGGRFTAIYHDRRIVLLEAGSAAVPARSSALPRHPSGGALAGEYQQAAAPAEPSVKLKDGQTPAEVEAVLGPPEDKITDQGNLIYVYPKVNVVFAEGRLLEVEYRDLQPAAAAAAPPPHVWIGPKGQPLPFRNDEEILQFLRTAKVVSMRDIGTGITNPQKVLLEKDGIRAHAVYHSVNEDKTYATMAGGGTEMFFRDSYIFQAAAYELSRLLDMKNVPPAVLRTLRGNDGSLQLWVENTMNYTRARREKLEPPDRIRWSQQIHMMRFFDALIHNTDRNTGNMLSDRNWNLWLIDHTRAFRRQVTLRSQALLIQCDRKLYERVKDLNEGEVKQRLKPYLRGYEIDALLVRRKKLIEHFEKLIREKGENKVLFTWDPGA